MKMKVSDLMLPHAFKTFYLEVGSGCQGILCLKHSKIFYILKAEHLLIIVILFRSGHKKYLIVNNKIDDRKVNSRNLSHSKVTHGTRHRCIMLLCSGVGVRKSLEGSGWEQGADFGWMEDT